MEILRISQGTQVLNVGDYNRGEKNEIIAVNMHTRPTEEELRTALAKINSFFQADHIKTEYIRHEKLNELMLKIVDTDTNKVILEVPPEKILDMVAKMCEMAGILIDKKA